ncbi:uncharacterized protein N7484_009487 [Penicillium longicatenatum]|uniref:uncharacterized protein n=1 Tax=Penicillium longicatenatum TaxID=1561947 RepID=UPI00254721F7|nr:uncharacterized protein N7484_009487 [Penicillium longicatenatum]KAJ5636174.1 hypothetical protein N7484_009487 [Penicillium longicatenatum]
MSLWKLLISPRPAEETRGEGSDNDDSFDLPLPSAFAPLARRERARLQRRVGATASAPSTKKSSSRGTRSPKCIRNLQVHVSRALGITRSSASSPETTANNISTERPFTSPVISSPLKREQSVIEEQTPAQQDFSSESPLSSPPSTEEKASGSVPAPDFSSPVLEAANTLFQSTGKDRSPGLSAPSPTILESSSFLRSSPDIIAQFQAVNTSFPTNPLCSTSEHSSLPIGPSTPIAQKFPSSPLNPSGITTQAKDEDTSTGAQYLYFIPQYHSSPIENTLPVVPQSTSSPFSSSPIESPTGAAAIEYLYSIPQYYSPPTATTPPAVPQSTSSLLSSPSSIAQFRGMKKAPPNSPQYHSFPMGTAAAADMPKSRKQKSSSIELELPRTSKRRSPGIQEHDPNISKQSISPNNHSRLHAKRKRDGLEDKGLFYCSVEGSLDGHATSSESANSLISDNGSGDDYEPDSSHNQRWSESPSPLPSPPKRAKTNPKQQVNKKKQDKTPLSIKTKTQVSTGQKRLHTRGREKSNDSDTGYVDVGPSDESDYRITSAERNDLLYELTRERASRMAEAVEIPPDSGLGSVQVKLVRKLATRGCKPVMSRFWASDFTTWPESLFTSTSDGDSDSANGDVDLMFRSQNMSDNYAIKALQELFAVSGRVRDCSLLSVEPQFVVGKAIRQYLHWAIDDAGLKTTGQTIPVHCICPQIPGEEILATIMRCSRKLERLAKRHQMAHAGQEAFWPTMIGFVIAGPIVCLLSLDTDPNSEVWSTVDGTDEESPAKFLTQFDLSEREQDVWNSLAVAICVVHLRDTLIELAVSYPWSDAVPVIRGLGDETDDEDL